MDAVQLKEALDSNKTVIISSNCTITYSGRAESFLAEGDRIILIKADKTLLVHQPAGSAPINYMKEGTSYKVSGDGSKIILEAYNQKEFMTIILHRVYSCSFNSLSDTQKLQLTGSEKDMAGMVYKNPELIEPGFRPLSMEEHTKFGFIDVFGYDKDNILVIVECKRYAADMGAVEQLKRYVDKVKSVKGLNKVRGIIAAPKIVPSAAEILKQNGFEFRSVSPPKYLEKFDSSQKKLDFEQPF